MFSKIHIIKRLKDLLLCKSEACAVSFRCCRNHRQIIQIREYWLLRHPRNPRHHCTLKIWIGLKGRIEKTSHERRKFLPVAVDICLLHRGIVLIKKYNYLLPVIPAHIIAQLFHAHSTYGIIHPHIRLSEFKLLIIIKYLTVQQITIVPIQLLNFHLNLLLCVL